MQTSKLHIILFLVLTHFLVNGQDIEVFVDNNVFHAPDAGSYVETDMLITAPSIHYQRNDNGKFQGRVEVSLVFEKEGEVAAFEKYVLHSVEIEDTNKIGLSLIDKKRFTLPEGAYAFNATFKDLNTNDEPFKVTESVIVDHEPASVQVSDIDLIDEYHASTEDNLYTKSGYYMVPYVINYFPENIDKLTFYAEVYNTDQITDSDQFLAVCSIQKFKEDKVVGNLFTYKKLAPQPVSVLFNEFDISQLHTGNYNLVIEIKDKQNRLLAVKKLFFQRFKIIEPTSFQDASKLYIENTFVESFSKKALNYHLRSLLPIANVQETNAINNLLGSDELLPMQQFFLNFWLSRNKLNPYIEWQAYADEVKKVNDNYTTNLQHGFETDRGRVYLQYGPPNQILSSPREPGTLPYEIWTYNHLENGQLNVKFVFYNPDLVTNTYDLIHSTANGEIKNDQWQRLIQEPFVGGETPLDSDSKIRDHYGSKTKEYYAE